MARHKGSGGVLGLLVLLALLGGYGTWNVGLRYPDRFAGIVPIAGGISRKENVGTRPDTISRVLLRNGRSVPSFFLLKPDGLVHSIQKDLALWETEHRSYSKQKLLDWLKSENPEDDG